MDYLVPRFTQSLIFPQSRNLHRTPSTPQFPLNLKNQILSKSEVESNHIIL